MGRAYGKHGKKRNVYRIIVRKPKGKKTLRRPRPSLEDNIETYVTNRMKLCGV
jgi:hypothetical protein